MQAEFLYKKKEISGIWSFFFSKPDGFSFKVGDYSELELHYNPHGGRRWFTIASAPHEQYLQITTPVPLQASEFKQRLNSLISGDVVRFSPAMGNFNLPLVADKLLFIAAGVGVTPYRAMIVDSSGAIHDIHTIYASGSNRYIFCDELSRHKLTLHDSSAHRIKPEDIFKYAPDWQQRLIYLAGPQDLMTNLHEFFLGKGHAIHRLRLSYFTNYNERDIT